MIRGLVEWSSKISGILFLVIFSASNSLAASNDLSLLSDTLAKTIYQTNESLIKTPAGINSKCFVGYSINFSSAIDEPDRNDMPFGPVNECFEDTAAIALHRDGDQVIWSLAPSLDWFSLNPMDNIKNLRVQLQYRF